MVVSLLFTDPFRPTLGRLKGDCLVRWQWLWPGLHPEPDMISRVYRRRAARPYLQLEFVSLRYRKPCAAAVNVAHIWIVTRRNRGAIHAGPVLCQPDRVVGGRCNRQVESEARVGLPGWHNEFRGAV